MRREIAHELLQDLPVSSDARLSPLLVFIQHDGCAMRRWRRRRRGGSGICVDWDASAASVGWGAGEVRARCGTLLAGIFNSFLDDAKKNLIIFVIIIGWDIK